MFEGGKILATMRVREPLRILLTILAGWLCISIACNYPGASNPEDLTGESLRATLAAQGTPVEQPAPTEVDAPTSAPSGGVSLPTAAQSDGVTFNYRSQTGDTLSALAGRFGVEVGQVRAGQPLPPEGLLPPGLALQIPDVLGETLDATALLPDSAVVYSPAAADFDPAAYISQTGGTLATFTETVNGEPLSGAAIVERVAIELSVNPRLLLAFLEYRSSWVSGVPPAADTAHPLGLYVPGSRGLYAELSIVGTQLNVGYYGWRHGTQVEVKFQDGVHGRLAPGLNAGSAALQQLVARIYKSAPAREVLYGPANLLDLYQEMFGDPWASAGPLFPDGLAQPSLELPFAVGERWSFTGGPHAAWNTGTPAGALDFSPVTGAAACAPSPAWVTASAGGLVTRSEANVVVIDLDGDGFEGTGWTLFYLHIADRERIAAGTRVEVDQPIGHPSCERGRSTGTHVHLARRFNGEWLLAAGPLPFILSGWQVQAGTRSYEGELVKDGQIVSANPGGPSSSLITR